jgi:GTP-binding protein
LEKQRLLKLLDLALEVKKDLTKRISTSALNEYLLPIIAKTPPPSVLSRFIKIKFISQVAIKPPTFVFFCNEPDSIKDNYKRFLERKLREKFGFKGIPVIVKFKKKSVDDGHKRH